MEDKFDNLLLGVSTPSSVPLETIEVEISSDALMADYARAFVRECRRVNILKAEQVGLTEKEMVEYAHFLLKKRIEVVNNDCPDFRKLKVLYIPTYLQYNLRMIGQVVNRDYGLKFVPVLKPKCDVTIKEENDKGEIVDVKPNSSIKFEEALVISEKIGAFESDVSIVTDAFPKSIEGNVDVMQTAIIAGYVRSTTKVDHIASTYVSAVLDMKLKKETAFQVLYRVQYDDISFIASVLPTKHELFH